MGLLDSFPRQDSKRQLTVEEKLEAIRRVTDLGETKASVSRMYGVPESTLRGWCKNKDKLNSLSVNQTRGSSEVKKRVQSDNPNVGRYEGLLMTAASPRSPEPKKLKLELDVDGFSEEAGVETSTPPAAHSNGPPLQPLQFSPAAALNLSSLFAIYCAQTGNQPVQNNAEEPLSLVKRPSSTSDDRTENYSSSSDDSQNSCRFSIDGNDNNEEASDDALKAIKHGEQFLRWLEGVSDPSITRLQLFQFRCLLEKVKTASFSRKIRSNPTKTT